MTPNATPQRLNPFALISEFYHLIREWVIPLIVLLISLIPVFMKHHLTALIPVLIIAVIVIFLVPASLRYWYFKFALEPASLVIYSGIFNHQINHIPYQRIQSVNQTQWAFLKPFHLVTISVETAGHSDTDRPEAVLSAVKASIYDQLVAAQQQAMSQPTDTTPTPPNYTINRRDLREFAMTSPAFLSVLVVLLAGFGKLSERTKQQLINWAFSSAKQLNVFVILGSAIAILAVFYLGSIITLILTYYGFNLTRQGDHLIIRRGWFKERQTEIAIDRIQAIRLKQPLVRHWLHLVTVQLIVISNDHQDDDAANVIIMPVIKQAAVNDFLATFFPQLPSLQFTRNHDRRNFWLNWRNYLLGSALVILPLTLFWRPWGSLSLAILFITLPMASFHSHATTAQVLTPRYLLVSNSDWFTRSDYLFQRHHVQTLQLRTSLWLQKRHYGHLTLQFRAGQHGKKKAFNYLPAAQLQAIRTWYDR
ncbi:PH domain-containing protein [Lactiplantibacillus daowaiensis]|uniref:PH domain-containing protein n=1 Tax=Lactiplantibacillus daowaiensis TaxID=2559918 RepID=A0ABW1RZ95_9LACO|nr:PH domain-containing protein [Lactiplantibacillus daowaiensis]